MADRQGLSFTETIAIFHTHSSRTAVDSIGQGQKALWHTLSTSSPAPVGNAPERDSR